MHDHPSGYPRGERHRSGPEPQPLEVKVRAGTAAGSIVAGYLRHSTCSTPSDPHTHTHTHIHTHTHTVARPRRGACTVN